jgi:hypothetical protein
LGGSITAGIHNWPEPVVNWFGDAFPDARISVENAAIGATGSPLAIFRAERDIIQRKCDLVFIEYAVNDWELTPKLRGRTREGLIRKLLEAESRDLVLGYAFRQEMYENMRQGIVPPSIAEFEELASHYDIGSTEIMQGDSDER